MEGLLRRLSADGSEAENALRVIAFFDRLVEARGAIDEVVRSSARLIGGNAGYQAESGDPAISYDSRGRVSPASPSSASLIKNVASQTAALGQVWIDTSTDNAALGELVVERMALAAGIVLGREARATSSGQWSAVATLIATDASPTEREEAARAIGFRVDWTIRAVVVLHNLASTPTDAQIQKWADESGAKATTSHQDDAASIVLVHERNPNSPIGGPPWSALTGIGSRAAITDASESLRTARLAVRLTSSILGPTVVDYDKIGPFAQLSSISREAAGSSALVKQLIYLAQSDTGRAELEALDGFCRYRALRPASIEMNLHHSSLANRLKNAERKIDINLDSTDDVAQLTLALQLYRIATSTI